MDYQRYWLEVKMLGCCKAWGMIFWKLTKGIINLNYADDTLLFWQADKKMVAYLLWLDLNNYLSELKMNFEKEELLGKQILSQIWGCKIGPSLSLIWVCLCIGGNLVSLIGKSLLIRSKKSCRLGKVKCYGGRLILFNSVLSSPLHVVSV